VPLILEVLQRHGGDSTVADACFAVLFNLSLEPANRAGLATHLPVLMRAMRCQEGTVRVLVGAFG
jgi:hypothetical protein